jgi:hypothetical protein
VNRYTIRKIEIPGNHLSIAVVNGVRLLSPVARLTTFRVAQSTTVSRWNHVPQSVHDLEPVGRVGAAAAIARFPRPAPTISVQGNHALLPTSANAGMPASRISRCTNAADSACDKLAGASWSNRRQACSATGAAVVTRISWPSQSR